jgi:alpha-amylase/alpha-mannosidase (GH57 family)
MSRMASAAPRPLTLVLLWHMHQPDYRDHASGDFRMPWVYLHALKDYADMAWHLEHHPEVRAVVNFTPILLERLDDYAAQFSTGALRDPLLRLLARPAGQPLSDAERVLILTRCFPPEHARMAQPSPAYDSLRALYGALRSQNSGAMHHLSDQYFDDLLVWHHLRWTGETVRRTAPVVTSLMAIGTRYSAAERRALLGLVGEVVRGVVPRYARLAATGRVELSTTPYHHPLAPLLLGFESAREARPQLALPHSHAYPGGHGRVAWHLDAALEAHSRRFGDAAGGIWPAEGAISMPLLGLLAARGCAWAASGSEVLAHSGKADAYRAYRYAAGGHELALFFRDDRLSDLIGFEYPKWNSHDAAANLIGELEAIAAAKPGALVSIALDGENCWEFYPYNGYDFLSALYEALASHPRMRTATYRDCLREPAAEPVTLDRIVAGSWVSGDLATWIGSPQKNHAWELLCAAKQTFDLVVASGRLDSARSAAAFRQLAACEASDPFWWAGSDNPPATVAEFDRLFRAHLSNLYRLLELPVPAALAPAA